MRIAELCAPKQFRVFEAAPEPPAPGEIQVRVRSVGICGSDLHYYSEGSIGDVKIHYPVVLGHEPTGEVLSTGHGFAPGDRVMLEPAVYCYHCEWCRSGRHNICEHIRFFSSPPDPGFFRDVMNLPAHNVLALPAEVDLDTGTLFEPLAVVLHSLELAQVRIGEDVAVFGAGPIGLLTVASLKTAGAGRIWCVEPRARRRELAAEMGAYATLDTEDAVGEILRATGKRGVDAVFDCATKTGTTQACADVLRNGGRLIVTGIPSERETPINFHVLRRKEATVFNVRRSNHETPAAARMLAADPKRFAPLVTHRMSLESCDRAFHLLETGEDGAAKIVIQL